MLPKVNGMDVLKRIRARPEYKALPVIVFSNSYSSDVMQQAWGFGATDVLHKSSTTPRNVVLALVRAIAANAPASAPAEPAAVAVAAPPRPESELTALLQRLASGDIEAASADFVRVVQIDALSAQFPAPMMKLFSALEVLVATADQTAAGPGREPIHDSIRAVSRVARTMASQAKVAC
jgi:CheY-like chemotaxis protein